MENCGSFDQEGRNFICVQTTSIRPFPSTTGRCCPTDITSEYVCPVLTSRAISPSFLPPQAHSPVYASWPGAHRIHAMAPMIDEAKYAIAHGLFLSVVKLVISSHPYLVPPYLGATMLLWLECAESSSMEGSIPLRVWLWFFRWLLFFWERWYRGWVSDARRRWKGSFRILKTSTRIARPETSFLDSLLRQSSSCNFLKPASNAKVRAESLDRILAKLVMWGCTY